ncbi:histone-lysine N-methyltransferase SETMAR [Trichonephila inaurata madagascariensis]|uniref:Histone-lysine N-methyltransferase SETMAR n=1 Tax=Trichonephila inaurata madagascariensis TaxID=2747483 RepID=A0A8X6XTC6_9ARAC|nr:histone-lysine N-methyltransferase SETMAR [Trichonephila inaurata madagascariensis]
MERNGLIEGARSGLFTTSKWAYQPLHQVTEYVKRLGIVLSMNATIEEDSSQTCGELARQFNTSSETVRLHLHHLGKTYRLSKWVPQTLLEVHKQQRMAACLSLLSRHRSASIFNRVLTSDEKWVLYDTPKRSKHWLSRTAQDHLCTHARLCFVSAGLIVKWFTMSCYQRAKRPLRTCIRSNSNVHNRRRRSHHWLIERVIA